MPNPEPPPQTARQRWMAILARANATAIREGLADCGDLPAFTRLRGPETGLVMTRGRAGGSGAPFNLGEVAVTRCSLRTDNGSVGHAYVIGRDTAHAEYAAQVDALMQDPQLAPILETRLIAPLEAAETARRAGIAAKAEATKVRFFAMRNMRT